MALPAWIQAETAEQARDELRIAAAHAEHAANLFEKAGDAFNVFTARNYATILRELANRA